MFVRHLLLAILTAFALAPAIGHANQFDLALDGADTVAYFVEDQHMIGSETFAVMWRGQEWRFINADHRAAFEANPFAFVPAYAGQCATCMAKGNVVPGDPGVWAIIDGQLYLNRNATHAAQWQSSFADLRPVADAAWLAEGAPSTR